MSLWIGVDPGGRRTGLVLRDGTRCLGWKVVERDRDETEIGVGPYYWREIYWEIQALMANFTETPIAIEGVRKPVGFQGKSGHREFAKPIDLMGLAATFASVVVHYEGCVIVPPGGNGSGLLASYPNELITDAERQRGIMRKALGNTPVSHARSAWDVAGTAARMRRAL